MVDAPEDFWDDLLGHMRERALVPVVGSALLRVDGQGDPTTLMQLLGRRLAERYRLPIDGAGTDDLASVVKALFAARGRAEGERTYRVVNDFLLAIEAPTPPALRALGEIRDFPLFLSTTFDSMLTQAVDAVRFDGNRGTRELFFAPNQSTVEQQRQSRAPLPDESVVYKLFGHASSMPQYVLHDEDLLEWMHALLSETSGLPDWMRFQLRESPLLFIGCRLPDWMGRPLVRMASNARLSQVTKQLFIVDEAAHRDSGLAEFLQTYLGTPRVQVLAADPTEFALELRDRWKARQPAQPKVVRAEQAVARGSIFISYVREDAAAARALCDALTSLGGDVWLDERRLAPGDAWDEELLSAIRREVQLFVPVISQSTESRREGYAFREWAEALKRSEGILGRRFIVPVVIDADYGGDPGIYRQMQEEMRRFHFGHAPAGAPNDGLRVVFTEEIRAMRRAGVA